MTDEFDVFGDLDALCDDNILAKFKSSVPLIKSNKSDDDDDDFREIDKTSKHKSSLKHDTLSSQKCFYPVKSRPPKKHFVTSVEDSTVAVPLDSSSSLSTVVVEPSPVLSGPVTRRRQTRSMSKNKSAKPTKAAAAATTSAPTIAAATTAAPTIAAATTTTSTITAAATAQQPSVVPRSVGRGRKKQKRNQNLSATVAGSIDLSQMESSHTLNPIQQMFNRRNIAAARAAMYTNVDYVDLVSSPVPKINGVIDVDSDTEDISKAATSMTVAKSSSLNLSFDEENPEISVKVIWNGCPEVFQLRRHQKFTYIFNAIALREKTPETSLVFNLNNKILSPEDTPASIDYKIFQFINGRVLVSKFSSPVAPIRKKRDANKILLKVQSDKWKKPLQIELLRTDNLKVLYIKCSEELNIPYENLTLSFDGEPLEFGDTPATLELEGGEAIDLRIRD